MSELTLVTGGGGFLGRAIVRQLLDDGQRVRIFARGAYPELAGQGVEVVRGDLRDAAAVEEACRGVDCVYHTAGIAGIWGPWREYYQINTLGTRHVIEACRRQSARRLVYTSSPSVTFDGGEQCGIDESAPYARRWLCHYPHSKALAEQEVLTAHGQRLATCALRPHLIWGPGDEHLIPRLLARARAGRLRRVGEGTNLIDTVYVDNAAAAHVQAAQRLTADSPVGGRAYFISQGQPVNCWQWIDQVLELAGLPPVDRAISLSAAWRLGAVCEAAWRVTGRRSEPPMTRFLAAQLGCSHYFDIGAANRDFGYRPEVSSDEGMSRLGRHLAGRVE